MKTTKPNQRGAWRVVLLIVIASIVIAACSGSSDSGTDVTTAQAQGGEESLLSYGENDTFEAPSALDDGGKVVDGDSAGVAEDGSIVFQNLRATAIDAKVIRDGRIDVRIDEGEFDSKGVELRAIAAELGGYISSGESHVEEYDTNRYAVGWFTMKVPSDGFEDAVDRVERLGVRVSSALSSQDVTEEYVDLEGRLSYWEQQEAFYTKLLNEATTIDDLVTLQARMQDVLLNIEEIEGRLRYLDGRTAFATLTVGLTEVPDEIAPVVVDDPDPGPIAEAFDQAGELLLATVAFMIVAAAVVIPLGILAMLGWLIFRLMAPRKHDQPVVEG
jgi:hypothetical protein